MKNKGGSTKAISGVESSSSRSFAFRLSPFALFRRRSDLFEHLDTGDYTAEEYEGCLVELRRINRWLGDASALRKSLLATVRQFRLQSFTVLDVGAGSGELLRVVDAWARAHGIRTHLVGLELNHRSAQAMLEQSQNLDNIEAVRGDALKLPFADNSFDYVMCSLFTHHFDDDTVVDVLNELKRVARRRVFVLDLHRHRLAYYLYRTLGRLVIYNRLVREDGAVSILRSFQPAELRELAARARMSDIEVSRRFPFRLVLSGGK